MVKYMAFLDTSGLSKVWQKIQSQLSNKADKAHDHSSITGTASNVTGVVSISHGGTNSTSRSAAYSALMSGGGV